MNYRSLKNLLSLGLILVTTLVPLSLAPTPAEAADCSTANVRWASTSNTITISGEVSCTLSQLKAIRPTALLQQTDPENKIWHLRSNLKLENGASLLLHGSEVGGDVDELRLQSNNDSASTSTIWIRAQWGAISIDSTKITSWSDEDNGPDMEYATYKRSYIHVRSYLDADGETARQSQMDIKNSEVAYLGYDAAESYGLTWKVSGTPSDELFAKVDVLGSVTDSNIHHNYFGFFSYGAYGMVIARNEFHHNVKYGFDPHDDSDSLLIEDNYAHHNGNHGIICSKRCDNLIIRNNRSEYNIGHGIMLHWLVNESLVENNIARGNTDTGIVLFDSHNNIVRNNTSVDNLIGLRLSVGSANNLFEDNISADNTKYGIYFYEGNDIPVSGDGRPKNNTFKNNLVENNANYAVYLSEADDNLFENNQFLTNGRGVYVDNARRNRFKENVLTSLANNYYDAKNNSTAMVEDVTTTGIKVSSQSSIEVISSQGAIFKNSKSYPTVVQPTRSLISQAASATTSLVTYEALKFFANPSSGNLLVKQTTWTTSSKKWQSTPSAKVASTYTIGDLTPLKSYKVRVNSSTFKTLLSDSQGNLSFSHTPSSLSTISFSLDPA